MKYVFIFNLFENSFKFLDKMELHQAITETLEELQDDVQDSSIIIQTQTIHASPSSSALNDDMSLFKDYLNKDNGEMNNSNEVERYIAMSYKTVN